MHVLNYHHSTLSFDARGEDDKFKYQCVITLDSFKAAYDYEEISELVERYKEEGISWKYTSIFVNPGNKQYIASTVDGDGNEIKIFEHTGYILKSIGTVARDEGISEKEVYYRYADKVIRTTMPQSSIRPRVMEKLKEMGYSNDLISIEYVPKTGKNKGQMYTQYYKGDKYNLFAWLSDVLEEKDGVYYKKTMQGTYWDYTAGTKNLTKEGKVEFPNGKKPEALIERILSMTTEEGDYVLDSFLGSGTTAAVAQKMHRRWIGIEMGPHAYTHCKVRMDRVIDGDDTGGISKEINWQGGGGYKFYELAEPLLVKHPKLPAYQINPSYTWDMVCQAICKIESFKYAPNGEFQGYSSESRFIHITEEFVNGKYVMGLTKSLGDRQSVLIYCKKYQADMILPPNMEIKKIPKDLLEKCTFESEGEA